MHENNFPIEIPVKFASQSSNKESASIGLSISRDHADVSLVEEVFCAKRVTAELELGDKGRTKPLPGMESESPKRLTSVFDAKSYGSKAKEFTTRLVGAVALAAKLSQFAGRNGVLTITGIDALPEKERAPKASKKITKETGRGAETAEPKGKGHDDPISALGLSESLTGKLLEAGYSRVGELIGRINTDELWYRKIKGVGKTNVDKITDALTDWYAKNPQDEPEEPAEAPKIHEPSSDVPDDPEMLPIGDLVNYGMTAKQCQIVVEHITEVQGRGLMHDLLDWVDTDGTKLEEIPKLGPSAVLRLKEALAAWEEAHPAEPAM